MLCVPLTDECVCKTLMHVNQRWGMKRKGHEMYSVVLTKKGTAMHALYSSCKADSERFIWFR